MNLKIFQSYISDLQKKYVSEFAIPYSARFNDDQDSREYQLFKIINAEHIQSNDIWGLVSWKFDQKNIICLKEFIDYAKIKFLNGSDCVFINPMIALEALYLNPWEQGAHSGHLNLEKIQQYLAFNFDDSVLTLSGINSFALCNYFIGNSKFWNKYFMYIDTALSKLTNELNNKTEVGCVYGGTAHYSRDTGVTMQPFVIERLFSSFVKNMNSELIISPFTYDKDGFIIKFGCKLGALLHDIYLLKRAFEENNSNDLLQIWHKERLTILNSDLRNTIFQLDDFPIYPRYL